MKHIISGLILTALMAFGAGASASTSALGGASSPSPYAGANLGLAPPPEQIVSAGGMEWVYAGPCAPFGGCGDVLLHHGFGLATDAQWTASFASITDLTTAFTGLCASPWFNTVHNHCDHGDAAAGFIWGSPLAPDAFHRDHPLAETFLVRAIPEPGTYALMALGLGVVGWMARRRQLV